MAVYLTCTRTRGQQKKHIDICHRCDDHDLCRSYQEHLRNQVATALAEQSVDKDILPTGGTFLIDVLKELREIQALLSGSDNIEGMDQATVTPKALPAEISIAYLIQELEDIKSSYNVSSAGQL